MVTTSANEVKILDSTGALTETLPIDKRVSFAKFAPNSDSIAIFVFLSGDSPESGSVAQIWDLSAKKKVYEVTCHSEEITDVSFTPLAGLVCVSSADGSWSVHDFSAGKRLLIKRESAKVTALQLHPDGLILAIGLSTGKIVLYDIREMVVAQELDGVVSAPVS